MFLIIDVDMYKGEKWTNGEPSFAHKQWGDPEIQDRHNVIFILYYHLLSRLSSP